MIDTSSDNDGFPRLNYSDDQLYSIRCIALAFSTLSVCACLVMFYWYVRIPHKAFRHQLIMMLIMSDFLRTVWGMTYPIYAFIVGDVNIPNAYCQASGFFVCYFMECSDLIILIIAVHTAIYVFHPRTGQLRDQGGLWRWRYWVFSAMVLLAGLITSLAFANSTGPAFIPAVTWCFLPVRPIVWRLSLFWAPRYFVFLCVTVIYMVLWFYVNKTYREIGLNVQDTGGSSSFDVQANCAVAPSMDNFAFTRAEINPVGESVFTDNEMINNTSRSSAISTSSQVPRSEKSGLSNKEELRDPQGLESLQQFLNSTSSGTTDAANGPLDRRCSTLNSQLLLERKAAVTKQMRNLFVFPLVYLIQWVIPFANHIVQYTSEEITVGVYISSILANVMIPSQGFINVIVYAAREKPWQPTPNISHHHTSATYPTTPESTKSRVFGIHRGSEVGLAYVRRASELRDAKAKRASAADGNNPTTEPIGISTVENQAPINLHLVREWWDDENDR